MWRFKDSIQRHRGTLRLNNHGEIREKREEIQNKMRPIGEKREREKEIKKRFQPEGRNLSVESNGGPKGQQALSPGQRPGYVRQALIIALKGHKLLIIRPFVNKKLSNLMIICVLLGNTMAIPDFVNATPKIQSKPKSASKRGRMVLCSSVTLSTLILIPRRRENCENSPRLL